MTRHFLPIPVHALAKEPVALHPDGASHVLNVFPGHAPWHKACVLLPQSKRSGEPEHWAKEAPDAAFQNCPC